MQIEDVMIAVAVLCLALIALIIFICKASYEEGYLNGYDDCREDPANLDMEYKQGYEDGYKDARKASSKLIA